MEEVSSFQALLIRPGIKGTTNGYMQKATLMQDGFYDNSKITYVQSVIQLTTGNYALFSSAGAVSGLGSVALRDSFAFPFLGSVPTYFTLITSPSFTKPLRLSMRL